MKNTNKRFLSLLLTALLLLGTVSFSFAAAAGETKTYAVGDIIEYGTYPQTLTTDPEVITALEKLVRNWYTYDYEGTTTYEDFTYPADFNGMQYTDAVYKNVRYRGVKIDEYRPFSTPTGQSEGSTQALNGYRAGGTYWFRYEPLRWRILNPETGLVMSDMIIDSQPFTQYMDLYAVDYYPISGEYGLHYANIFNNYVYGVFSSISEWLNEDFYNTAFNTAQQGNILQTEQVNDYWYISSGTFSLDGNGYHKYDATPTQDKIFLPAWDEITNEESGFSANENVSDPARTLSGTDYAKAQGLEAFGDGGTSRWLLRTMGRFFDFRWASLIDETGKGIAQSHGDDRTSSRGIVPMMYLEEIINESEANATLHPCDNFYFGAYPQSKLTDENVIALLNQRIQFVPKKNLSIEEHRWNFDADYYTDYADLIVGDTKYRAKILYTDMIAEDPTPSINSPRPKVYSGYDYSYTEDGFEKYVYYYVFEPLLWRVLDPETGLAMTESIVESQVYQKGDFRSTEGDQWAEDAWIDAEHTHYATDYTVSNVRRFLNDEFYNIAFNDAQRTLIQETELDNRSMMTLNGETGFERYDWDSCTDNVFLLSTADVLNPAYGFNPENKAGNSIYPERVLTGNDYSGYTNPINYDNNWLLRNVPKMVAYYSRRPGCCDYNGHVWSTGSWAFDLHPVAPAIRVDLTEVDYVSNEVACAEHTPVTVPVTPATCTEAGVGNEICAVCGEVLRETVAIPVLGHNIVPHEGKAPTCKDAGWAAYDACSRCDYTTYQALQPTGIHTPDDSVQENVVNATCKVPGSYDSVVYCSLCGDELSREAVTDTTLPHTPGDPVQENAVASTCKTEGSYNSVVRCTVCGEALSSETVKTPVSNHTPGTAAQENVVTATCTAAGSYDEVVRCKDCGTELSRTAKTTPKSDHKWNAGAVTAQPTCTVAGVKTFTCVNCTATKTAQVPALGHSWGGWTVTKQPTCTAEGQQTRTCTRDGSHKETQPVAKNPHTDNGSGYCKDCGADLKGSQRCKYCGEIHTGPFAWLIKFFHSILALFGLHK